MGDGIGPEKRVGRVEDGARIDRAAVPERGDAVEVRVAARERLVDQHDQRVRGAVSAHARLHRRAHVRQQQGVRTEVCTRPARTFACITASA